MYCGHEYLNESCIERLKMIICFLKCAKSTCPFLPKRIPLIITRIKSGKYVFFVDCLGCPKKNAPYCVSSVYGGINITYLCRGYFRIWWKINTCLHNGINWTSFLAKSTVDTFCHVNIISGRPSTAISSWLCFNCYCLKS